MTRATSIEAYNQIKEEGLVGRLQFEVYSKLYDHGPLTQGELTEYHFPGYPKQGLTPRFAELEGFGIVTPVAERPCKITGRTCIVWDVTDKVPIKPDKKKSKDKIIAELQEENKILKSRLSQMQGCLICRSQS